MMVTDRCEAPQGLALLQEWLPYFDLTFWIQLLVQGAAVAHRTPCAAQALFTVWIWSVMQSAAAPINTSCRGHIYVPLVENFPFLSIVPLMSSLCSGPLENSTVKLS